MIRIVLVVVAVVALVGLSPAQMDLPDGFMVETVSPSPFAGNFPTDLDFLPDGRIVITTKGGFVLLALASGGTPGVIGFLQTEFSGERGISGLAVDPNFENNGYIYMHYAPVGAGIARISRFTLNGDRHDRNSLNLLMTDEYVLVDNIPENHFQHSGGGMSFGTDGMLYSAHGDDRDDCQATDRTTVLGSLLRLDVSGLPPGPGGPPAMALITPADNPFATSTTGSEALVAAWGLRQPFTMELDEVAGQLYIGDVGNGTSEELDCFEIDPAGGLVGTNYGWPEMEGTFTRQPCSQGNPIPPLDHEAPIYEILHSDGAIAIMMMTRYRNGGRLLDFGPGYEGDVFFCDWGTGEIRRIREGAGGVWALAPDEPGQPASGIWANGFTSVAKWKRGPDGALYYMRTSPGEIGRIRPIGLDHEIICEPTIGNPGSIDLAFRGVGGAPGNTWFYGLAVDNAGSAPNGWFFGIDMTLVEIQAQINLFVGLFDQLGQFELRAPLGALPCPLGFTVDAVLLEIGASGLLAGQGPAKTITF